MSDDSLVSLDAPFAVASYASDDGTIRELTERNIVA